ncbi:T9SS C-terminal target domain-containing protein, partial [Bacteroidetes/Chlorobi group bacterium ChocPot_Mid]
KWDNDQNEWYLYQTTNLPELYTGNYSYKVSAYNSSGDSYGERIVQPWCSQTNDVTNIKEKEIDLRILPNPIINSTQIEIFLPFDSFVSLDIFDYSGQFLENILKEFKESGLNQICYSPNIQLTNGVYFIKLSTWNSQGIYLSKFKNIIYEKK